jgi:F0F1-type ATP synthase membrane subunit c/vacuolar-type H+-ATPase subunit K
VEQIAALRPRSSAQVKAEGIGIAKAAQIEGLARQPEISGKLASAAAACVEDISRN